MAWYCWALIGTVAFLLAFLVWALCAISERWEDR